MTTRIRNADIIIAYDAAADDHVYRRDLDVVFDASGILHLGEGFTGEITREIDGLTVTKLAVGPMNNNAYLLRCTQTDEGLLIDAANEADRLRELLTAAARAILGIGHQPRTATR